MIILAAVPKPANLHSAYLTTMEYGFYTNSPFFLTISFGSQIKHVATAWQHCISFWSTTNSVALVCEWSPLVGEVSANLCRQEGVTWSVWRIPMPVLTIECWIIIHVVGLVAENHRSDIPVYHISPPFTFLLEIYEGPGLAMEMHTRNEPAVNHGWYCLHIEQYWGYARDNKFGCKMCRIAYRQCRR
jgi:hypothetical protein